jgi:hypothetical protein
MGLAYEEIGAWTLALGALTYGISHYLTPFNLRKHRLTSGQITRVLGQMLISGWLSKVITGYGSYDTHPDMEHILFYGIGFYVYDLLYMMTYQEGRQDYVGQLHHIGAIIALRHLHYYPEANHPMMAGIIILLLEISAMVLNITFLYKLLFQSYVQQLELINIIVYATTRVILIPIGQCVSPFIYYDSQQRQEAYHYKYALPLLLNTLLTIASMFWFKTMIHKYRVKYYIRVD